MRNISLVFFLLLASLAFAQDKTDPDFRVKKFALRDTIVLDSVSINSSFFQVFLKNGQQLDSTAYSIDYGKAVFSFRESDTSPPDTLIFKYRVYPEFLTKKYFLYDRDKIVNSTGNLQKAYALSKERDLTDFTPFDGLQTSGSIVRGVTVGNNQNSTVNSELDLQISGQLSDKVGLRASIQDANIPQQEGGYSQRLDEFDQIFIELYSDNWNIRAGDINLENNTSYFGRFNKKVQGLSLSGRIDNAESETDLFATGALVKGVFTQSRFTGQEGNQGPYKLTGPNGELYVLIVSGSERVFVNGILLKRGENEDYVIDYNAGEIRFNPTFPINSEMRISVEYQYSEQNFTRIIAYAGGGYKTDDEKLTLRAHVYSENDAKNQPLLQNLNADQVDILQSAGDDKSAMIAPSATADSYSDNKILYRKDIVNGQEIFVFSNNPDDELYNVRFSLVGANQGNYILSSNNAISRIYEYVAPVNGVPQGNYAPVVQLFAPTKLQMAVVQGNYEPTENTKIFFEGAGSKNDLNLFSDLDDQNNDGFAGKISLQHQLLAKNEQKSLDVSANIDYIQDSFTNVERTYNIEFNRDWNLPLFTSGDQTFITTALHYTDEDKLLANYTFENLNFGDSFAGNRHLFTGFLNGKKIRASVNTSFLNTKADTTDTRFFRIYSQAVYDLKKAWVGARLRAEDNQVENNISRKLDALSQRFTSYEGFTGVGDSTNVFVEVGYRFRVNDSLKGENLSRVNTSNTYYLKSQLVKNSSTSLGLFVNYRTLDYSDENIEKERSLNSRLIYDQSFFNDIIRWNTVFETNSGTLPQQEFTYVKVDEGQGTYTWNDYNGNGVQELQEFEVAQFRDEADFIKILLPNQVFVRTHQNKLSQLLTFNFQQWSGQNGFKKFASHFYNQTSYLIDRKILRDGDNFDINPFNDSSDELGLNLSVRNTLFYNRGQQKYSTSYTYLATTTKNLLSIGLQENELRNNQFNFLHRIKESYLFNLKSEIGSTKSTSENYENRNFDISNINISPKISYLFTDFSRLEAFYSFGKKDNELGDMENLKQQNLGLAFSYNNAEKISLNGEVKYIKNSFTGSPFSPVAYQMLEGLQPGTNFTWNLLAQRRLTKFLDLNISYFGRKSENTRTIHTGNVQLRAFF
tara:strand:- start:9417 stop:12839 length:3423 start_codon:yes stop_codon:yes gene_type:complete